MSEMQMPLGWEEMNKAIRRKLNDWDGSQGGAGSIPFAVSYLMDVRDMMKEMAD